MPLVKPSCVRDLRARVNIVDVVSRVVTLKKAGNRFKGLCPFHQEKSPSFHVNADMGVYKCFGCGKSGDMITFVRETEGLNFVEAVEALGQRYHIPIEYEQGAGPTREERSLRQELFELHEVATEHFHQVFRSSSPTGEAMRRYWLEQRKFSLELAEEFKIGAAEPVDTALAAALLKRRFSEEALRQSGLFFIRDGALPGSVHALRPRFRGRLMIPIRDHQGRVVAFTARQTELTPADDPAREAKYVNSPETPIFTKGHLLFNLDRARTQVTEGKPFVMVEGQLDALRCWSVGVKTAIAPQGTAITESQLGLLRRYHSQVECFFDSDSAGQKAALRFLPLALKAGLEVRFLGSADEQKLDPDLLFRERGLEAYEALRDQSRSAMQFACRALLPEPRQATPERKARAAELLFEIVAATDSEVVRAEFLQEAAAELGLPAQALAADYARSRRKHPHAPEPVAPTPKAGAAAAPVTPEQHLLLVCLHYEQVGNPLSHALPHDWIDSGHTAGALLNRFLAEFEQDSWPGRQHLDPLLENAEERALIAELLFEAPAIEDPLKVVNEALRQLQTRALQPRLRQIELALAGQRADIQSDSFSLLKERSELQRQLRQPLTLVAAV